jgi:hypothetical protein
VNKKTAASYEILRAMQLEEEKLSGLERAKLM